MNRRKCNKAFTLAEILITLMIIGILAMVTLPSIIQTWEERATVSKVKKIYSILQQAYTMAEIEYGPPDTWGDFNNKIDILKEYLTIDKSCETNSCLKTKLKYLNSNDMDITGNFGTQFSLKDQTEFYCGGWPSTTCQGTNFTQDGLTHCFVCFININTNKKRDVLGKDVFGFSFTKRGFLALGGSNDVGNVYRHERYCKNNSMTGTSCAKWVIERSNMDYLHKDTEW